MTSTNTSVPSLSLELGHPLVYAAPVDVHAGAKPHDVCCSAHSQYAASAVSDVVCVPMAGTLTAITPQGCFRQ
jgi:hypothetical protein